MSFTHPELQLSLEKIGKIHSQRNHHKSMSIFSNQRPPFVSPSSIPAADSCSGTRRTPDEAPVSDETAPARIVVPEGYMLVSVTLNRISLLGWINAIVLVSFFILFIIARFLVFLR